MYQVSNMNVVQLILPIGPPCLVLNIVNHE